VCNNQLDKICQAFIIQKRSLYCGLKQTNPAKRRNHMACNREWLEQFLIENGHREDVDHVMQIVQPHIEMADSGVYKLACQDDLDPKEIAGVISLSIHRPVERIVFISSERPFPQPDWMSDEAYQDMQVTDHLIKSIKNDFWCDDGMGKWVDRLIESIGEDGVAENVNKITDGLGYSNRDVQPEIASKIFKDDLMAEGILDNIGASLGLYLCYFMVDDHEGRDAAELLVKLLPKCYIFGAKADELGVWLVLTA